MQRVHKLMMLWRVFYQWTDAYEPCSFFTCKSRKQGNKVSPECLFLFSPHRTLPDMKKSPPSCPYDKYLRQADNFAVLIYAKPVHGMPRLFFHLTPEPTLK